MSSPHARLRYLHVLLFPHLKVHARMPYIYHSLSYEKLHAVITNNQIKQDN